MYQIRRKRSGNKWINSNNTVQDGSREVRYPNGKAEKLINIARSVLGEM